MARDRMVTLTCEQCGCPFLSSDSYARCCSFKCDAAHLAEYAAWVERCEAAAPGAVAARFAAAESEDPFLGD